MTAGAISDLGTEGMAAIRDQIGFDMKFDIQPYLGALPVTFGMQRNDVHQLLGPPDSSYPNWDKSGYNEYDRDGRYNVGYDNDWMVNHIGFVPGSVELTIQGQPIWALGDHPDPNPVFLALDSEPLEHVGFWIFLRIGVTTTGYHDGDENQLAVTVFPRDTWANRLTAAKPADTSKYRLPRR